jgi:hypothetical protein
MRRKRMSNILIAPIVSGRDKDPYVHLIADDKIYQLSIADARNVAADLVQCAARAEADAMILKFFSAKEFPTGAAIALMLDFRSFRARLDTVPTEHSHTVPVLMDEQKGPVQ